MKRRNSLKTLAGVSVGTVALGYWAYNLDFIRDLMSNSFFKPSEQDLITSIADTIIPKGELYGAVDLGVPIYLLRYFEKCEEQAVQDNIKLQLKALNISANKKFGNNFGDCSQLQREELLMLFANSQNKSEKEFFDLMKEQIIHGFRSTREVMTDHYNYMVVPGHYYGCIDIGEKSVT